MNVTIKYFASIREAIGHSSESRETSALNLADLRDELLAASPAHAASLARGRAVRMAVNQVMTGEAALLTDGCEIAFFPPVTGG
ncbi:Molybdenum cofactor biosynthesis protein MoaD [Polaromonas sp. CG9_12]|uniref:MoaD/ThiS family protein n=1 Tax=Polaromonas sp. CG_9.11 TaxID=2787730 RepID=UPI0004DDCE4E|nr:MoaD/ThiS family protein [Polaromonas sp. CG_9.11]MBG6076240.1 molybdopterin synthase sulfur carrier subunit [Polaromonas sp. CG_9.11]CDS49386.1 Molybdenum cofactor biosynthesis protein MoaD [Polaromonas sp. CG9_12]